ncbi:BCCT family transporter [Haloflavibacter putidus]|uniref:BCCT family transporter n=1 Tax=Haloflavibacter putidus TaxID=2576776 RepID=A0A507ZQF0_9FLAO|nr:BCCT family transporter [Haloflavibacter putidus]TQD38821.1 BCCT family transporter [Haloflavibacter putidus]
MAKKVTRRDNHKSILGLEINPPVFFSSTLIIVLSVVFTIIFHKKAEVVFTQVQESVANKTDWLFILCINIFLVFLIFLAISKYGRLRIGGQKAKPEFKKISWFAMLFSAGMGIGLLFFGVAEPIQHLIDPPTAAPNTIAAAHEAMNFTFLHYGFHAWAVYALVGLALAYFTYSKGLPLTIRSIFHPFLGSRIHGPIGNMIDTLAVLATMFGLATTLGFGVQQMASGLNFVFDISNSVYVQILLIVIITAIATASVILGVDKGVKILSEWNMRIALLLLLLVVILGPTIFIFRAFVENTGNYLYSFLKISMWSETFEGTSWQNDWTVFYWSWWIGWSPFVGMFIARISKGRTVREFILGVLLVPSVVTFFWMSTFGSVSLQQALAGDTQIITAVQNDISTALFVFFQDYPLATVINIIAIILIAGFFITSSDSGSLVIDNLTSGGKIDSPVKQRVFWAIIEGAVAAALLLGGGLAALRAATIVTGLPFAIVLTVMCFSLYKGLKDDFKKLESKKSEKQLDDYQKIMKEIVDRRKKKE